MRPNPSSSLARHTQSGSDGNTFPIATPDHHRSGGDGVSGRDGPLPAPREAATAPSRVITVLIADRDALFRRGVAASLEAGGLRVADGVDTAEAAVQRVHDLRPAVVLVGTALPDAPGLVAAAELRRRFPALATIVVADAERDDEFLAALRAGITAYFGKHVAEDDLLAAVERAAAGEVVINAPLWSKPSVVARIVDQLRAAPGGGRQSDAHRYPLTDRELEILAKVRDGMTNPEIGRELGISAMTVKNHLTAILRKMGVHDRTEAVTLALRRRWLSLD